MEKPILTTRETNKASKLSAIISGIIDVVFVIFVWNFFKSKMDALPAYMHDDFMKEMFGTIAVLAVMACLALIYTAYQFMICRSYVDVYEDRLVGRGIQNGYQLLDFDLSYDKITNITCSGIHLFIHTPGGKYKIVTNVQTAGEVFQFFHSRTGRQETVS